MKFKLITPDQAPEYALVKDEESQEIIYVGRNHGIAKLVATAPELLEACNRAFQRLPNSKEYKTLNSILHKALLKATT